MDIGWWLSNLHIRLFIEPLLEYIEEIDRNRQPNEIISIVVPQFVPRHLLTIGCIPGRLIH